MPAEYTIDTSKRMVFSVTYGILTDEDVYAHQEKLRDDPDFDPSFPQLARKFHQHADLSQILVKKQYTDGANASIIFIACQMK